MISTKLCGVCGIWYFNTKYCPACKKRENTTNMRNRKLKVLAHYGEYCNYCGEDTFELLQIDHINNDGAQERRELYGDTPAAGEKFYRELIGRNFPPGYQTLCRSCNWQKYIQYRRWLVA